MPHAAREFAPRRAEHARPMASDLATRRLLREFAAMRKAPPDNIVARPLESNVLEWHYVITGTKDSVYEGGHYHGKLRFPTEYPLRPPSVLMCTPSGRFKTNCRLCLSMSDFHPESWNPMWSVSTILTGLYSFMLESSPTLGSVEATPAQRRKFAAQSLVFNCANETFRGLFPDLVELHEERRKAAAEAGDAPGGDGDGDDDGAAPAPGGGRDAGAAADEGEANPLIFVACVGATLALLALLLSA